MLQINLSHQFLQKAFSYCSLCLCSNIILWNLSLIDYLEKWRMEWCSLNPNVCNWNIWLPKLRHMMSFVQRDHKNISIILGVKSKCRCVPLHPKSIQRGSVKMRFIVCVRSWYIWHSYYWAIYVVARKKLPAAVQSLE